MLSLGRGKGEHHRKWLCFAYFGLTMIVLACRKHEHLLTQIQDQADALSTLLSSLEQVRQTSNATHADATSPDPLVQTSLGITFHHAVESAKKVEHSYAPQAQNNFVNKPGWIAQARSSIEEFEYNINVGQLNATQNAILSTGSNEASDNEDLALDSHELSAALSPPSVHRTLARMPPEAAPFGLIARLSLRKGKDVVVKMEDQEAVGLVNDSYFKPCEHRLRTSS